MVFGARQHMQALVESPVVRRDILAVGSIALDLVGESDGDTPKSRE
jgi:hypothetical protein